MLGGWYPSGSVGGVGSASMIGGSGTPVNPHFSGFNPNVSGSFGFPSAPFAPFGGYFGGGDTGFGGVVAGPGQYPGGQAHQQHLSPILTEDISHQKFDEFVDDEEVVRNFFERIDLNKDGIVSADEIRSAMEVFKENETMVQGLETLLEELKKREEQGQNQFFDLASFGVIARELPRIHGQRVQWAKSLRLENVRSILTLLVSNAQLIASSRTYPTGPA